MEEQGLDPMIDCKRGECGVCTCDVIEGEVDHRDYFLSDSEKPATRSSRSVFPVPRPASGAGSISPRATENMMEKYRDNPQAIRELVREAEVHKDLYINQELFELEMEQLFVNTWVYVGHASQVPNKGDFYTTTVGTRVRHHGAPYR